MAREIKFRGRNVDTGEWVYGDFVGRRGYQIFNKYYIVESDEGDLSYTEVDVDTVGQYVSLKDKNGVEIYEGDVVEALDGEYGERTGERYEVQFAEATASFVYVKAKLTFPKEVKSVERFYSERFFEVIGNIYENPDLLKR